MKLWHCPCHNNLDFSFVALLPVRSLRHSAQKEMLYYSPWFSDRNLNIFVSGKKGIPSEGDLKRSIVPQIPLCSTFQRGVVSVQRTKHLTNI